MGLITQVKQGEDKPSIVGVNGSYTNSISPLA